VHDESSKVGREPGSEIGIGQRNPCGHNAAGRGFDGNPYVRLQLQAAAPMASPGPGHRSSRRNCRSAALAVGAKTENRFPVGPAAVSTGVASNRPDQSGRAFPPIHPGTSMIKAYLCATLFMICSCAAQAAWVAESKEERFTVYLDASRVVKSGDSAKVWTLYDYKAVQTGGDGQKFLSVSIQTEIDCKQGRLRLFTLLFHSGPMATGQAVTSESGATDWEPVSVENKGTGLWKLACAK
jgi:hypothetical protein